MRRRPRFYFSLRSPYSWLTVRRLRETVPDLSTEFECLPYWDPDEKTGAALAERGGEFHYAQMSRAKHLYMLMDTKRLARSRRIEMSWPVDVDSWWERPHLAWLASRRYGLEWAFYDTLMAARWGRGEDICTEPVVRAAAESAGFDPDVAAAAGDDQDRREEGVECLYQAYLDDVFGIPYLKWGPHRFWGLDRVEAFLDLWLPTRPVPTATRYEDDNAGGCG